MTIPILQPKQVDPLDEFAAQKAHWGETSASRVLNIRTYWDAIAASQPIPTFQSLNRRGLPVGRARLVDAQLLQQIIDAQPTEQQVLLSNHCAVEAERLLSESLEVTLNVDAIVVRHLRRWFTTGPSQPHKSQNDQDDRQRHKITHCCRECNESGLMA